MKAGLKSNRRDKTPTESYLPSSDTSDFENNPTTESEEEIEIGSEEEDTESDVSSSEPEEGQKTK